MQTLYEAASHIAQEIERTRQHLANLEQALAGLRPLITIDAATNALPYAAATSVQNISDVSEVREETSVPLRRKTAAPRAKTKTKPHVQAAIEGKPTAIPKTGSDTWLNALGRSKLSLDSIVDKVLASLKLGTAARPVIRNRAGAWLHSAAKNGVVMASSAKDGAKLYQAVRAS